MKRTLLPLLCAAALSAILLVGCTGSSDNRNVDVTAMTGTIEQYDKGGYTSLSIGDLKTIYDIDSGDVKQFVAKQKGDASGYVIIEATSGDAAARIESTLNNYTGRLSRTGFDTVVRDGHYVALFSSATSGVANKMADAFTDFLREG